MLKGLLRGAAAGAAGTTALNAVTYLDMAWRGRPASSTPQQAVEELASRAGQPIPGAGEERENRLDGLGALAGVATGIGVGALAGVLRPLVLRLGPVLGPVLLGPRQWDATAWLIDAAPHLAFGVASYATLRATTRR
jgi:hypothetical protein